MVCTCSNWKKDESGKWVSYPCTNEALYQVSVANTNLYGRKNTNYYACEKHKNKLEEKQHVINSVKL